MSDTVRGEAKRYVARREVANRRIAAELGEKRKTPPPCGCACHTGKPGSAAVHPNEKCPCKQARRRLV